MCAVSTRGREFTSAKINFWGKNGNILLEVLQKQKSVNAAVAATATFLRTCASVSSAVAIFHVFHHF